MIFMDDQQNANQEAKAEVAVQPVQIAQAVPEAAAPRKAAPRKRTSAVRKPAKAAKKEVRTVFVKSKRKEAIARARIRGGSGIIRLNRMLIQAVEPGELRRLMLEPVYVSDATRSLAKSSDIELNVQGGGMTAQAEAARSAIAKALAAFSGNDVIRKEYMRHDRSMVVDDPRRVESKKFKGPKARARFQTSYR